MDLVSISKTPIWVSTLFIITFSFSTIYFIINALQSTFKNEHLKKLVPIKKIVIFYLSYFLIVGLISLSGFFNTNTLPPRIIITTSIPLFLFYIFYVSKKNWFQLVLQHIKLEHLVTIHLFRFVGVFFLISYYYNALPKNFAYTGGFGDIISALLAILVILFIKKKMKFAKTFTFIWNIIGLIDIFSVLILAIIITKQSIENNQDGVIQFSTFPFSWIPAFAPATIIFLHLLIFKKLKQ